MTYRMMQQRSPWPSSRVSALAGFLSGIAVVLVMVALTLPARAGLWDATTNTTLPIITFTPQTEIPGSGLTAQVAKTIDQPETFIGGVIVGVYRYGVWLTITAAIFATMLGGLLWMLAGGNASRVDTAKRLIGSSLFGLVLAFTSYLILQGINPRLLELKLPVLPKVQLEVANRICCPDKMVTPDSPQTYHYEQNVKVKGSTWPTCEDGRVASAGIGKCVSTCCVCEVVGGLFGKDNTTVTTGNICYIGAGLTREWCETETGKPGFNLDGVRVASVTKVTCDWYEEGDCNKLIERKVCDRTFNRN